MKITLSTPERNTAKRLTGGFTLIELLITMTILIIIIGAGIPSLSEWFQHQKEASALKSLGHLTTFARTKAVKENQYLTVCASNDQRLCNGEWNKTIIVFTDPNKNETLDTGETLFQVFTFPKAMPCLEWKASLGRHYLQFKPSGATNGSAGHFKFCDSVDTGVENKLVISLSGRTSLKKL